MKIKPRNAALLAVGLAFLALALPIRAAQRPKAEKTPIVVSVDDIERDSVRVDIGRDKQRAFLRFAFRSKTRREVEKMFFRAKPLHVRVMDGTKLIAESKRVALAGDKGKKTGGLVLTFESIEEARRAATALRPYLK